MAAKTRLSKDDLKKVSGGTVFTPRVSVQKVRHKVNPRMHQTPKVRGRARD